MIHGGSNRCRVFCSRMQHNLTRSTRLAHHFRRPALRWLCSRKRQPEKLIPAERQSARIAKKELEIMVLKSTPRQQVTADEALKRLIEGNQRFVRGELHFPSVPQSIFAD